MLNISIVWSVSYFSLQDRLLRDLLSLQILVANWAILSTLVEPNTNIYQVNKWVPFSVLAKLIPTLEVFRSSVF